MTKLQHLFGSKCRAAVLELLVDGWSGTVSELARRAGFSPRTVAVEIRRLVELGTVEMEAVGAADVVRLRERAEWAKPLRALVHVARSAPRASEDGARVRESLAAMGAPLAGTPTVQHLSPEDTLIEALKLARREGTVFRVLPLVIARNEQVLDWGVLKEKARRAKLKAELGLLVSIAGRLAGRPSLAKRVDDLRDRRRTVPRYLPEPKSAFERTLADRRTPRLAREWGFRTNISEESLKATLSKHGA